MTSVLPMHLTEETGEDLFENLSDDDRAVKILEREFPYLCNDIGMIVRRPFILNWDPTTDTASTDCKAEINLSPYFFLNGYRDVGYGTAYHECGHICHSPYGVKLLQRANKDGGETLQYIMNIILDRKDDMLTVKEAPGFGETLRARLVHICTMTRREEMKAYLSRPREQKPSQFLCNKDHVRLDALRRKFKRERPTGKAQEWTEQDITSLLKHFKPRDPYEDFFFAAKWHKSPRFKVVYRIMHKYLTRKCLLAASEAKLLWIAERIHEQLGKAPESKDGKAVKHFAMLMLLALMIEKGGGKKLPNSLAKALQNMAQQYVATIRSSGLKGLLARLKAMGMIHPGPLSTGSKETVPVKKVPADAKYASAYQSLLAAVQPQVSPLVQRLRRIDNPSEFEIYGQEEGELDLSESARIATALSGYHMETVTERDIDAELHLAIDCSGSMGGDKVHSAKKLATVFSEAVTALRPSCEGCVWAFSSNAIYEFGPLSNQSGFVTIEGEAGNSDTHMLRVVGSRLSKSYKRRKILLVLCDDGPDDMEEAKKISHQLLARGIIVVHLLVGVHGTPSIYPFELLYTSMDECVAEFGDLIESIIKNLK